MTSWSDAEKESILHSAKRIVMIERAFNKEVDLLLETIGLTRESIDPPKPNNINDVPDAIDNKG